jgi:hypothetical protein
MKRNCLCAAIAASLALTCVVGAGIVIGDNVDAAASSPAGPGGLSASAGAPALAEMSDSLLVSLGFDLMGGITITSGDGALNAPGSHGLGAWGALGEGDGVGDPRRLKNDAGGDLMEDHAQIIGMSSGHTEWSFTGVLGPDVAGSLGGIAADPPLLAVPGNQRAASDAIAFTLALSETDLATIAGASIVELGSGDQYLAVPAAGAVPVLLAPLLCRRRRRPV